MDRWSIWWEARPRYVRVFLMVLAGLVIALLSVRRLREVAGFPTAPRTASDPGPTGHMGADRGRDTYNAPG
jgi:hypothetical protein